MGELFLWLLFAVAVILVLWLAAAIVNEFCLYVYRSWNNERGRSHKPREDDR